MYPTSKSQVYHHIAIFAKKLDILPFWDKPICIMIVPLQVYVFEETVLSDINMFPSLCLSFNIYVHYIHKCINMYMYTV
jgi:hypothetical protein